MAFTEQEIAVLNKWEARLKSEGIVFSHKHDGSFAILAGVIADHFGGVWTEANLDAAVKTVWPLLHFESGFEMPDPRAAEKTQTAKDKRELDARRKQERPQVMRDPRLDGSGNLRVDREAEAKAAEAAKNDVNNPAFQRRNDAAKYDFQRICDGYLCTTASGRVNHSLTGERREHLSKIRVSTKDAKGKIVLLYADLNSTPGMLTLAKAALDGFERENEHRVYA